MEINVQFWKINEQLPPTSMYTDETIHFTDIYLKTTRRERETEREKYIHRDKKRA